MATNITHIKKITIGTPVKKVTGAAAQTIGDLTDIQIVGESDGNILAYNAATGKWTSTNSLKDLIIAAGGIESVDSAGGDF